MSNVEANGSSLGNTIFKINFIALSIGDPQIIESFSSEISMRLENNVLGSRYPFIQKQLFYGELSYKNIPSAIEELKSIQQAFGQVKAENFVSLSDTFITNDGMDLFEVLFEAFSHALSMREKITMHVENTNNNEFRMTSQGPREEAINFSWGPFTPEFVNTEEKKIIHIFNNNLESDDNIARSINFATGRIEWFDLYYADGYTHEVFFDDRGQAVDDDIKSRIRDNLRQHSLPVFKSEE